MSAQADGRTKTWAGSGDSDGNVPDSTRAKREVRATTRASVLVGTAAVLGIAPNWFTGRAFISAFGPVTSSWGSYNQWLTHSLWFLVTHDAAWAGAIATLSLAPVWFWWWRRSGTAFGGAIGALLSLAAIGAVGWCATTERTFGVPGSDICGGTHWSLYAASIAFTAAFLIAPAPRDPEELNALKVRALVRRHRRRQAPEVPSAAPTRATAFAARVRARARRTGRHASAVLLVGVAVLLLVEAAWLSSDSAGAHQVVTYTPANSASPVSIPFPSNPSGPVVIRSTSSIVVRSVPGPRSLTDLARNDPGWAAITAWLLFVPVCFWAWQRHRLLGGRVIGALGSVVAASSMCALVCASPYAEWVIRTDAFVSLAAAGFLLAAAFLVAPDPSDPDAIDEFAVRRMVRRHREGA